MDKIIIINTGGTFNKCYNPLNGELIVDKSSLALITISQKWFYKFDEILEIVSKDSLDIDDIDRLKIVETIRELQSNQIIIIHGTDTIDITAKYIDCAKIDKKIILTGAMMPYSIDSIEATANLTSAYGYIKAIEKNGVYISMNGAIGDYKDILKDRELGRFRDTSNII